MEKKSFFVSKFWPTRICFFLMIVVCHGPFFSYVKIQIRKQKKANVFLTQITPTCIGNSISPSAFNFFPTLFCTPISHCDPLRMQGCSVSESNQQFTKETTGDENQRTTHSNRKHGLILAILVRNEMQQLADIHPWFACQNTRHSL